MDSNTETDYDLTKDDPVHHTFCTLMKSSESPINSIKDNTNIINMIKNKSSNELSRLFGIYLTTKCPDTNKMINFLVDLYYEFMLYEPINDVIFLHGYLMHHCRIMNLQALYVLAKKLVINNELGMMIHHNWMIKLTYEYCAILHEHGPQNISFRILNSFLNYDSPCGTSLSPEAFSVVKFIITNHESYDINDIWSHITHLYAEGKNECMKPVLKICEEVSLPKTCDNIINLLVYYSPNSSCDTILQIIETMMQEGKFKPTSLTISTLFENHIHSVLRLFIKYDIDIKSLLWNGWNRNDADKNYLEMIKIINELNLDAKDIMRIRYIFTMKKDQH